VAVQLRSSHFESEIHAVQYTHASNSIGQGKSGRVSFP
jgi:hypothetical protein